jgi:hypothetical protein
MISIYKYFAIGNNRDFKQFPMDPFKDTMLKKNYWFVGPQSDFVRDKNGKVLVDFIGRFENLQSDFDRVCPEIGLPPTALPHVNKSKVIRKYKGYQDYYDKESKEFIAELYKSDIELFGYEFDRSSTTDDDS